MSGKNKLTGKFKSKAKNILNPNPRNMENFIKDTQNHNDTIPQIHENTDSQMGKSANDHFLQGSNHKMHKSVKEQNHKTCRLHIQIRQDLADKLLDMVFKRKLDPKIKNRDASQRVIIEEALEGYFKNEAKQKWPGHTN